jgi:ornithine decarboxylase
MEYTATAGLVERYGTPTLFMSDSRIRENYRALKAALPNVQLFYAVKANSTEPLVRILAEEGSSFDVSTAAEIDLVRACRVKPGRCIHTHPVKRDGDIRYALEYGIRIFVADNEWELSKFLPYRKKVKVLVRMSIENPAAMVNLSHKFGVAPSKTFGLIRKAHAMGLTVAGISFHCGSQNESHVKYLEALGYCRDICRKAALNKIPIEIIDIGGGFPITYLKSVPPIMQFCRPINEYLDRYFSNYRVIAEPGRYICGTSMTLAARVIGKSLRKGVMWYYLDEGLYGSFSGKVYDHTDYPMVLGKAGKKINSVLAGPTCDSTDIVYENIYLPELEVGDVLLFGSMGAYTTASATNFNGFPKAGIVVVDTRDEPAAAKQ